MKRSARTAAVLAAMALAAALAAPTLAKDPSQACKAAMNARIQTCTDACTKAALAAASNYVDTNNNVKFGCMKGCAIHQVQQMRGCTSGGELPPEDPTETNPSR